MPLLPSIDGSQRSAHFRRITNIQVNLDGATLLSNSKTCDLYKMCAENGLVDNYAEFNGLPMPFGLNDWFVFCSVASNLSHILFLSVGLTCPYTLEDASIAQRVLWV